MNRAPISDSLISRSDHYQSIVFWVVAFVVIFCGFVIIHLPFFLGEKSYFHDNLATAMLYGLFYDRLFSGDSWLWSGALNGGHPLWVSFGAFPIIEPVALLVYPAAVVLGSDWFTAILCDELSVGLNLGYGRGAVRILDDPQPVGSVARFWIVVFGAF
jgi:ABC-type Co2+ transport system permease subunit